MVMECLFGLGVFEFNKFFYEDEYNVYLKGFIIYGWFGGLFYFVLVIWILVVFVFLFFKFWLWIVFVWFVFVVFVVYLVLFFVIDMDYWWYMYMLYGFVWGLIVVDWFEVCVLWW